MFWRKPKVFLDPDLGQLSHRQRPHSYWVSAAINTPAGSVLIDLPGDSAAPSSAGLAIAKQTLSQLTPLLAMAIAYVQTDASAREFIEGQGDLLPDGISFTEVPGAFKVELALSDWPDGMVSVAFRDGVPCGVQLAD